MANKNLLVLFEQIADKARADDDDAMEKCVVENVRGEVVSGEVRQRVI